MILKKVRELEKVQDECEVKNCVKLKDATFLIHKYNVDKVNIKSK